MSSHTSERKQTRSSPLAPTQPSTLCARNCRANVTVHTDYMGGGFGSKFGADLWGQKAAELSKKAGGRPVKMFLDREQEHLGLLQYLLNQHYLLLRLALPEQLYPLESENLQQHQDHQSNRDTSHFS